MHIFKFQWVNTIFLRMLVIIFCLAGCSASGGADGTKLSIKNKGLAQEPARLLDRVPQENHLLNSNGAVSHLTQCNRDLDSLYTVNPAEYHTYLAEYDALMKSSAGFMAVKDDVSPEVADLARPRFQFALVNLCYRIKNALAQTLIKQAGGTR
ncbi:hypothetical protein [Rahnella laticis]|uniref:hypothetical protein n=1 Tax=Rahnella laticis TaxID=2787622 RepID=UPI0018A3252B|nr:hypothetical protein [Rahnella laticis]MBF7997769.1 hypothetical protein [Rahnella laticis]